MSNFERLVFTVRPFMGEQAIAAFNNGFGISVVRGPNTYGGSDGLYEAAVLHHGRICYDSGITDDVMGWLMPEAVDELIERIMALPVRS